MGWRLPQVVRRVRGVTMSLIAFLQGNPRSCTMADRTTDAVASLIIVHRRLYIRIRCIAEDAVAAEKMRPVSWACMDTQPCNHRRGALHTSRGLLPFSQDVWALFCDSKDCIVSSGLCLRNFASDPASLLLPKYSVPHQSVSAPPVLFQPVVCCREKWRRSGWLLASQSIPSS